MTENLKAKLKRILDEAWPSGDLDALDEIYDANFIYHNAPFPDILGLEASKQDIAGSRAAFPDIQWTSHEMVMEGDTLVTRYTLQMTHTGESSKIPVPPTGCRITYVGCMVSHFSDGRIVEEWNYGDYLGMLQQLGVIPPMG
jgi:predicted ester cyclase